MLSRIVLQLFALTALFGASLHTNAAETEIIESNKTQVEVNTKQEVFIDPDTGRIVTDQETLSKLKKSSTASTTSVPLEQTEVTMTKLENGATRIDFNGRFIRSLTVSVDEDGRLISHGHTELSEETK